MEANPVLLFISAVKLYTSGAFDSYALTIRNRSIEQVNK